MKILIAIESSENPKKLSNSTLRWASRAGFDLRIFIPDDNQLEDYKKAVADANHNWYINVPETAIIVKTTPKQYAKENGYDLLVLLPDDLRKWKRLHSHDRNVLEFATDIGIARLRFSKKPNKKIEVFSNGALMRRV